jgi:eukaryotic-like serine/threonine-protein kinase
MGNDPPVPDDRTVAGYRKPPPAGPAPAAPSPAPAPAVASSAPGLLRPGVEPDEIGRLGNYRVLRILGSGGMGTVYHAEDVVLRRPTALKVIPLDPQSPETGLQRFQREAQSLAGITHENLVSVYHAGQEGGAFYLAMELLEGEPLDARIRRAGPLDPTEVVRVARETAQGLAAIHRRGLVHRDIKPSNIWLEAGRGNVRILDFGLVRPVQTADALTLTGYVVGTPAFMSPEQARGDATDARSDLFSLGCVLYCVCTGQAPFRGSSLMAQLTALAVDTPRPVHEVNPRIPAPLSRLAARLLAKDPAQRPQSADEVIEELKLIALDLRETSRRQRRAVWRRTFERHRLKLAAALLLGVAAGVYALRPSTAPAPAAPPPPELRTPPPAAPSAKRTFLDELPLLEMRVVYFAARGRKGDPLPPPGPPNLFDRFETREGPAPRAIGMHPHREGPAFAAFNLGKRFTTFATRVSRNAGPPHPCDPLRFRVLGDGRELWTNQTSIRSEEDVEGCRVSVAGVRELRLELAVDGDPRAAHAVWIDPYLE